MSNYQRGVVSKKSIQIFGFCILQKLLFEYVYLNNIFPPFQYYGFQNNFNVLRYLLSWLLYMPVPYYMIRATRPETLSGQAVALFLNIIYMPCLILYVYMDSTPFIILIVLFYICMILSVIYMPAIPLRFKVGTNRNFEGFIWGIAYVLGFVVLFVWAYYARFRIQISFSDVYTARLAARAFSAPRIIIYARTMARSVVPLMAIYSIYKSKKISAVFFICIQIIQFFIDGSKSVIFVLLIGIAAYYFTEKHNHIIGKIPEIMSLGGTLAIVENGVFHTSFLSNTVFRRVMFVPALLNYQYYDLAQGNGIDYYRQSFSLFGNSRYSTIIARIVAQLYYGSETANANNGLFADAYINLGAVGCLIMPILIILVFKLIEGAGHKLPKAVWVVSVVQAFFSFTGSSFFTVLISHGIILAIIVLYNLTPNQESVSVKISDSMARENNSK